MENTNEVWKPVVGYENYYEVSSYGRVRSVDRVVEYSDGRIYKYQGKIMKPRDNGKGYLMVQLTKNNKVKHYLVHRLVACAFLENPENYPCVNHRDYNRLNNHVNNIEFCSYIYNLEYSNIIEKYLKTANEERCKPIIQLTLDGRFVAEYPSLHEASRQTGIQRANISRVCKGKSKHAGNYLWKYKNGTD